MREIDALKMVRKKSRIHLMIHKFSIALILIDMAWIVYSSLEYRRINLLLSLSLVLLAAIYYITTAYISKSMVRKRKKDSLFLYKCGYISSKTELKAGVLSIDEENIEFFIRQSDLGNIRAVLSIRKDDIDSYSIKKVDDYHMGIEFFLKDDDKTIKFTSKKIKDEEENIKKALGW